MESASSGEESFTRKRDKTRPEARFFYGILHQETLQGTTVAFSSDMRRVFFGTAEGSIKLCGTFRKLASEISPRDTFVFYAAAHGYTVDGRYYMIHRTIRAAPIRKRLRRAPSTKTGCRTGSPTASRRRKR